MVGRNARHIVGCALLEVRQRASHRPAVGVIPPRCRKHTKTWRCPRRVASGYRWCAYHLAQNDRAAMAAWRQTPNGVASHLRTRRGYSPADARTVALWILHPAASCAICGVPGAIVAALYDRGGPFKRGPGSANRRLQADRIDCWQAHALENTRPACWPCNAARGRGIRTDYSVAEEVRAWWRENAPRDLLAWLKAPPPCRPGEGVDLSAAI